jgi:hypothetical protein
VNVGFLGVITELTLSVVPDRVVYRDTNFVNVDEVIAEIGAAAQDPAKVDQVRPRPVFDLCTSVCAQNRLCQPHINGGPIR